MQTRVVSFEPAATGSLQRGDRVIAAGGDADGLRAVVAESQEQFVHRIDDRSLMQTQIRRSGAHQGVGIRVRIVSPHSLARIVDEHETGVRIVLSLRVPEVVARMRAAVAERAVHLRPAAGAAGTDLRKIERPSVADETAARAVWHAAEDVHLVDVRHVRRAAVGVARTWSAVAVCIGARWCWIRRIIRAGHFQSIQIEGVNFVARVVVVTAAPNPQDVAVGIGDAAVPCIDHSVARAGI